MAVDCWKCFNHTWTILNVAQKLSTNNLNQLPQYQAKVTLKVIKWLSYLELILVNCSNFLAPGERMVEACWLSPLWLTSIEGFICWQQLKQICFHSFNKTGEEEEQKCVQLKKVKKWGKLLHHDHFGDAKTE